MKKERSLTSRNFFGGLLGGITGILAFHYLYELLLPVGCLAGVIIGFWYQEIIEVIFSSWHQGISTAKTSWVNFKVYVTTQPKEWGLMFKKSDFAKFIQGIFFVVWWLIKRPYVFILWLKRHPMNRAYIIRLLAVALIIFLNSLWFFPAVSYFASGIEASKDGGGFVLLLLLSFFACCLPIFSIVIYLQRGDANIRERTKVFYHEYEYYLSRGSLIFFLKELLTLIRTQFLFTVYIIAVISFYTGLGAIFTALLFAPLAIGIQIVKGIYKIATETKHWLCLGTTVIITSISAWLTGPYLTDPRILWGVALGTGVVAGLVTLGIQRSIAWFYKTNTRAHKIATYSTGEQLKFGGQWFKICSNWFNNCLGNITTKFLWFEY